MHQAENGILLRNSLARSVEKWLKLNLDSRNDKGGKKAFIHQLYSCPEMQINTQGMGNGTPMGGKHLGKNGPFKSSKLVISGWPGLGLPRRPSRGAPLKHLGNIGSAHA